MRRGPPCPVCTHRQLDEIDVALASDAISIRGAAERYGLPEKAVARHRARDIPMRLVDAQRVVEVASASKLLEDLETLRRVARAIMGGAVQRGDYRTALSAMREQRSVIETLAKVVGLLPGDVNVNVAVVLAKSTEWLGLRDEIVAALTPFPDARRAVIDVVARHELTETSR